MRVKMLVIGGSPTDIEANDWNDIVRWCMNNIGLKLYRRGNYAVCFSVNGEAADPRHTEFKDGDAISVYGVFFD